jgi:[lysine-biosynthesis-protein LysW]--L-2-aminoadipate ligase
VSGDAADVIIDRCSDRTVAAAILPLHRATGCTVIGGGLAATGNRLEIATALANAGIPRPATLLATSEEAGLAAVDALGYPSTLMPLDPGKSGIPLCDREIAEAVLEHREVLGASAHAVSLIQAGSCGQDRTTVLVIGGRAVTSAEPTTLALAEATAAALGASFLGVSIATTKHGLVVWDVTAVPAFRDEIATHGDAIGEALVRLLDLGSDSPQVESNAVQLVVSSPIARSASARREVTDDVVLSA